MPAKSANGLRVQTVDASSHRWGTVHRRGRLLPVGRGLGKARNHLLRPLLCQIEAQKRPSQQQIVNQICRSSSASTLTYFRRGSKVRAHIIALIPPTTSSADGVVTQMPLSAYRGDWIRTSVVLEAS